MKKNRGLLTIILTGVLLVALVVPVSASISPDTVTATLNPGESVVTEKTVEIPALAPQADVIFAFDLTGSMAGILGTAQAQAGNIMTALDGLGVDIDYGVMSYMDYPASYNSCGYSATYGSGSDYAYSLDQAVTSDNTAVTTAIGGLVLGNGMDGPQDYTRIMYESYADLIGETNPTEGAVGWRAGSKKILVNFGDNVPHDCDLNEGVPGKVGTFTTGGDPGRNETMGDADDLELQTVLAGMAANGVILLECHTSTSANEYWTHWTGITGGGLYITGSTTLVDDIVTAVTAGLTVPTINVRLAVTTPGFEAWLTSVVPPSHNGVTPPDTLIFEETITVPGGTTPGVYVFTVSALDDVDVSYGDQTVTITVPGDGPMPPQVPGITGWGIIAAAIVLVMLIPLVLRRRKLFSLGR